MSDFLSPSLSAISRNDRRLLDDAREKLASGLLRVPSLRGRGLALEGRDGSSGGVELEPLRTESLEGEAFHRRFVTEAMVEREIRPPLYVYKNDIVLPDEATTLRRVMDIIKGIDRQRMASAIRRTGRVEFVNVPGRLYSGTGWIARKPRDNQAIIVTNRHVAESFADPDGRGGYSFRLLPNYDSYRIRLDLLAEHGNSATSRCGAPKVLFMAGSRAPDIALMLVEGDDLKDIAPVEFFDGTVEDGQDIAVIGYPANDTSSYDANLQDDLLRYFDDVYNVKRFSFGQVTGVDGERREFTHDATTMPGNSGSIVVDRGTGKVVGLHFAGQILAANYAVQASEIEAALRGLEPTSVVVSRAVNEANQHDGVTLPPTFAGRDGYNPRFLSQAALSPPKPGHVWIDDLADVQDPDIGGATKELKYRHFSVWMSTKRKLPLITAVNIDGSKAKRVGRIDKWYVDGRIPLDAQIDNVGYKGNALDRGHMVRREDPVWGDLRTAEEANRDTFHYTNAAPQHEALNQKDWLRLEEYVLGNAKTHGLKVSVFTGPVFADDDQLYRGVVRIPKAFWKIVAIINADTRKPSVTGYLLSQGDFIKDITREFVYGPFRTYQTEIVEIGDLARIDVAHLAEHDPMARARRVEGLEGNTGRFRVINEGNDLVL